MQRVTRRALHGAAQAKNKAAQLQEAATAASNDRDELQKKYEAKSRCGGAVAWRRGAPRR